MGISSAISDASAQGLSLALPFMGSVAGFWAASLRVIDGMGTVGQQVLAPTYEMELAKELRAGGRRSNLLIARQLAAGLTLGALLVPLFVASLLIGGLMPWNSQPLLVVCVAVMGVTTLSMSVAIKAPIMLGQERFFFWWSTTRLACVAGSFLFWREVDLAFALAITSSTWALLFAIGAAMGARKLTRSSPTNAYPTEIERLEQWPVADMGHEPLQTEDVRD